MLALPAEQGVPVLDMRDELTVFQGLDNPNRWQGPFRGSPVRWKTPDGEAVVRALREAEANPVVRPLGRLATRRAGPTERHETTDGTVVVPEDDEGKTPEETGPAATTHTEIQYLLLGSLYLTGVPRIRLLRPARPDPAGRPHGALAAAPFLATVRDRLRRGSFLACRAARPRIAGQFAASPFPRPFPSSAAFASPSRSTARFLAGFPVTALLKLGTASAAHAVRAAPARGCQRPPGSSAPCR